MTKYLVFTLAFCVTTAIWQVQNGSREKIYDSLETLAEILTIAESHSPQDVSGEDIVEGAIDGLLEQLDPHSHYYDADRYRTMKEDQSGSFFGIGIIVGYQNKKLTVIAPVEGTPAYEAGVRAGDIIAKIDGNETEGMDIHEGIRLLRGEEGTRVRVTILRNRVDEPLQFDLARAEIPTTNVRTFFMVDENTGYVALKDFGETATREVEEAIGKLVMKGMKQLILDLRGNPGGLLPQAIGVTSLFIPGEKLVVSTQGRLRNANQKYYSEKTSSTPQVPLVVLIDRGSASASEIVAGAIQDHDRGLIVGVNSWGKGLVQSVFPLDENRKGLALTTSRYYTPSGRNIQGNYDSRESYFNPKSSEDLYFAEDRTTDGPLFTTANGRPVLQARGITPDVYISFPEVPGLIHRLEAKHNAFFNFAARRQSLDSPTEDWVAGEEILVAFKQYLQEEKIAHEDFEQNREQIRQKITYQMLYIANPQWAWHYLMKEDHHIRAGLDLFDQARELLLVYKGEGTLRSEYAEELKQYALLHRPEAMVKK